MAGLSKAPLRLQASSLLEVMVSLVIIFAVFAIATGLYSNVTRSSFSLPASIARCEMDKVAADTKEKHSYLDENISTPLFTIEKTVKPYGKIAGALLLHLAAKNQDNKIVAERSEIILEEK